MKLTNYILDLGRVVAYYPGLKEITGSTTSSILLCQFLYWCNKTKDGWIWKTTDEIEEETGLTYNEQKTAKKVLKDLNLLDIQFKRLDHMTRYRVNEEQLNLMWEEMSGKKSQAPKQVIQETPEIVEEEAVQPSLIEVEETKKQESSIARQKALYTSNMKKMIEKTLNIIPDGNRWKRFIEFAYKRETIKKEKLEVFLKWALNNNYNAIYWTPEKMISLYPQAFIKQVQKVSKEVLEPIPVEEDYAPMPKGLGKKQELF